jgi:nitrogen-specific signal transduction histidine kinase
MTPDTWFAPAERAPMDAVRRMHDDLMQEMYFRDMLEAFPSPVAVLNRERQIVACNSQFAETVPNGQDDALLGLRLGESIGCVNVGEAPGGCGTGKGCRLCGAVIAMLQAQEGTPGIQECRINAHSDGSIVALDYRVLAVPLTVRDHEVTVLSLVDISDEKRRKVLERMFFHDVLNTASGVRSVAELYHLVSDHERDALIADLENLSTQLIGEIIEHRDLLLAERDELQARLQPTLPHDMIRHVGALYRFHSLAIGKDVQTIEDGDLPPVDTDPTLLGRVLGNLLKNALEASAAGDGVTLRCLRGDGEIHFIVHNPAPMPEDVKLQVFQRSFSTKAKDRGIGTYSARLLTERMLGGRIWFTSSAEEGTAFTVAIPLSASP